MRFRPAVSGVRDDFVKASPRTLAISLAVSLILHALGVPVALKLLVDHEQAARAGIGAWGVSGRVAETVWSAGAFDMQPVQPETAPVPQTLSAPDAVREERSPVPKPPPKLRPGSEHGDELVRVAWISWDDYQKLIAPRGPVEQPAVQMAQEPLAQTAPWSAEPGPTAAIDGAELVARSGAPSEAGQSQEHEELSQPRLAAVISAPAREDVVPEDIASERPAEAGRMEPEPVRKEAAEAVATAEAKELFSDPDSATAGDKKAPGLELAWAPVQEQGQVTAGEESAQVFSGSQRPSGRSDAGRENVSAAKAVEAVVRPQVSSGSVSSLISTEAEDLAGSPDRADGSRPSAASEMGAGGRPTSAPRADKESPPVSLTSHPLDVKLQPGTVLVGKGVEIKTAVPRLSTVARYMIPHNPRARIVFNREGEVISVTLLRSTGYEAWDAPVLASLYRWRASGRLLQEHPGPFELVVNLIFVETSE